MALPVALCGQDAPERALSTLHLYADTLQVPVLVLGEDRRPMGPVSAERFMVSLDSGPLFRATHVRREGDDPISLAVVLDTRQGPPGSASKVQEAVAGLAPDGLRGEDHVSVYGLDCELVRTSSAQPAARESLSEAVAAALAPARGRKMRHETCAGGIHLWDALGVVARDLSPCRGGAWCLR